jgi:hypothetical protein
MMRVLAIRIPAILKNLLKISMTSKIHKLPWLIASTIFFQCFAFDARSAFAAEENVVVIDQMEAFWGNCTVTLAPDWIHIKSTGKGFEIFSKGPDWKVVVFNRRDKTKATRTMKDWLAQGLSLVPRPLSALPATKPKREMYLNHRCLRYSTLGSGTESDLSNLAYQVKRTEAVRERQYLLCMDLAHSDGPGQVLASFLEIPASQAIPFECVGHHTDGSGFYVLKTRAIHGQSLSMTTFEPPTLMKEVKSAARVALGSGGAQNVLYMYGEPPDLNAKSKSNAGDLDSKK